MGRDAYRSGSGASPQVSIHAPAWGATFRFCESSSATRLFQSTRPRGARRYNPRPATWETQFQSTRPRGARQFRMTADQLWSAVSIHAPAWGATAGIALDDGASGRFNPRARVGRDHSSRPWPPRYRRFNPRARVGRDTEKYASAIALADVSIHAPAWGATFSLRSNDRQAGVSIHAPAWGATRGKVIYLEDTKFQSTRPRGARHGAADFLKPHAGFQSTRPRGARRVQGGLAGIAGVVSIHAPAWGATPQSGRFWMDAAVSIHAPAWGATHLGGDVWRFAKVSIHAPAWGATARRH